MNFDIFYQNAKVWQSDEIYVVSDGYFEIDISIEDGYKILNFDLEKLQAEKLFDLVEEFIEENKPKETDYDVRDEQGLFGYGY